MAEMRDSVTRRELFAPFERQMPAIPKSFGYKFGMALTAGAMALLPAIYLAMVLGLGGLVVWHAVSNVTLLTENTGRRGETKANVLGYFLPMLCGGIGVFFMLKPLFAQPGKNRKPRRVRREDEPLLHEYVDRLADAVGAPRPTEIRVDAEANASASFRRGWSSLIDGDLTLTLGLPLVYGMTLRQLTGVVAHEFGHFAQNSGMRATFVIRSINGWFARLVYERDAWDRWLLIMSQGGGWITILAWTARLAVWLFRRVLWCLMMLGHGVSSFMARQMEFDADRYEAAVAGSHDFAPTFTRLREIALAANASVGDLSNSWREGRLADNFPRLALANLDFLAERQEQLAKAHQAALEAKTGWFDSHPADSARIASVEAAGFHGLEIPQVPARVLFRQLGPLAKAATLDFYAEQELGDLKPENLTPALEVYAEQTNIVRGQEAAARYFQGRLPTRYPFVTAVPEAGVAANLKQELRAARKAVLEWGRAAMEADEGYDPFDMKAASKQDRATLKEYNRLVNARLEPALAYARTPEGEAFDPHGHLDLSESLLAQLEAMDPLVWQTLKGGLELAGLIEQAMGQGGAVDEEQMKALKKAGRAAKRNLEDVLARLDAFPYPYLHAKGKLTVADYVLPDGLPKSQDFGPVCVACHTAIEQLRHLQSRLFCGLVTIAEAVETAVGLPRLPMPKPEED